MSKKINISMLNLKKNNKNTKKKSSFSSKTKKIANDIRNKYINNLKEKNKTTKKKDSEPIIKNELSKFDETTHFLNRLAERRKKKKQTQKNCVPHTSPIKIKTEILTKDESIIPIISIKSDPPYGVLKNGKKKTYRQYFNKPNPLTCKPSNENYSPPPNLPPTPIIKNNPDLQLNENTLLAPQSNNLLVTPFVNNSNVSSNNCLMTRQEKLQLFKQHMASEKKRKYTIKHNHFTLGLKNNRELLFLKKNYREKIKYEQQIEEINNLPISNKKLYLLNYNYIRHGSTLPDELICQMYKDAILCGDINNIIPNNLKITIE